MEANQLLGLDVGAKHVGIARASSIAKIVQPLTSAKTSEIMQKLPELIKELDVSVIAVGLPRNLSGDDTAQTAWVRQWVNKAKDKLNVVFYWQDEALTSRKAADEIRKSKREFRIPNSEFRDVDEHAMAAAIILQDFLDTPETERVVC